MLISPSVPTSFVFPPPPEPAPALPERDLDDALAEVAAGLAYAHSRGVMHRDVKPSNCFVSPDGSVKVGDELTIS